MKRMNGIIGYWLELKKSRKMVVVVVVKKRQQTASVSVKLLQH